MLEEKVSALLSDGGRAKPVSFRAPKNLLDRLVAAYRKKVGAVKDRGVTTNAILYFAARGLVDWEEKKGPGASSPEEFERGEIIRPKSPKPVRVVPKV